MLFNYLLLALAAATTITASPIPETSPDIATGIRRRSPAFDNSRTDTTTNNTQANNNSDHNNANLDQSARIGKDTDNAGSGNSNIGSIHGGGNAYAAQSISCRRSLIQARANLHSAYSKRKLDMGMDFESLMESAAASGDADISVDDHSKNNSGNNRNVVNKSNKQDFSGVGNAMGAGMRCRRTLQAFQLEQRHLALGDAVLTSFGARDTPNSRNPLAAREIGSMADNLQVYARSNGAIACQGGVCPSELHRREAQDMLLQHARHLGFAV